jgi:hypothetical protein
MVKRQATLTAFMEVPAISAHFGLVEQSAPMVELALTVDPVTETQRGDDARPLAGHTKRRRPDRIEAQLDR